MEFKNPLKKCLLCLELAGLFTTVIAMPVSESLKWIGLALFLIGTTGRTILSDRMRWRMPNTFEWFLIALLIAPLLSTLFNWPLPDGITGIKEIFIYLVLGWLMSINHYTDKQMKYFLLSLIAGILIGLSLSAFDLLSGQNPFLEFKSIPNLNRSVIYHLMAIFTMGAMLLDNSGKFSTKLRLGVGICLMVSLSALIIMGSRAGIIAFFTGVVLLFILFLGRLRVMITFFYGLVLLFLLTIAISSYIKIPTVQNRIDIFKYYYRLIKNGSVPMSPVRLSNRIRYDYIRVAWAQITQKGNILFGSGPATFKYINMEALKFNPPLLEYKKHWDTLSHAHNAYLNLWVEQGLAGIAIYLSFLIYLGVSLYRYRSKTERIHWQWVACLGFLNTAVVAGLFNTVLANESAWQAMILTGIFIQKMKQSDRLQS
jgi:O-antigen ligase